MVAKPCRKEGVGLCRGEEATGPRAWELMRCIKETVLGLDAKGSEQCGHTIQGQGVEFDKWKLCSQNLCNGEQLFDSPVVLRNGVRLLLSVLGLLLRLHTMLSGAFCAQGQTMAPLRCHICAAMPSSCSSALCRLGPYVRCACSNLAKLLGWTRLF